MRWDAKIFKYLWYWLERYSTQDAPWWGNTYTVALEPWTNQWKANPQQAIDEGEWLHLEAGEVVITKLEASGFEGDYK